MKKFLVLVCIFANLLCGCATAITTSKNVQNYSVKSIKSPEHIKMDFIGFKIDSAILSTSIQTKEFNPTTIISEFDLAKSISAYILRNFGNTLQNSGIATDKSFSYFGIYSLQEMELYKSDNRYVTFVEFASTKMNIKDSRYSKEIWGNIAACSFGGGLPLLICGAAFKDYGDLFQSYIGLGIGFNIIGVISGIVALTPSKTQIDFQGSYNVYVYDTLTKAIVRKDTVSVNQKEEFEGSITYNEDSKEVVNEYLSKIVTNSLLQKYDEISNWISLLE